jgi:CheY-like chemotaxis protein
MKSRQGPLLIVEDIPDILNFLDVTLKFNGYRVVTARNGQEALEAIQKEHPAIIITDILMPTMDGFTFVQRLRLDPKTHDIPVVFISATYVAPEDKAFATMLGATQFIEKPIDTERLLLAIVDILKQERPTAPRTLSDHVFYENYRERLETKLRQKSIQIDRSERLLETVSEKEKPSFKALLKQTINEQKEIELELAQIRAYLEKSAKSD